MLDRESTVYAACGAAFAIGLSFIFIRAPHPWGIEGFDHYHQLALTLASGRPFPTMDVPWGYAYFLAAFYRLFGDHPAIPLTAQALLNAGVPLLVLRRRCWTPGPGDRWHRVPDAASAAAPTNTKPKAKRMTLPSGFNACSRGTPSGARWVSASTPHQARTIASAPPADARTRLSARK